MNIIISKRIASVLFASLALASLGGCVGVVEDDSEVEASAQALSVKCAPEVPDVLAVPEGNRLAFAFDAVGQQVYTCQSSGGGYAWVVTPDADLLKPNGEIAGAHYGGPTWEALDGSTVVGAKVSAYTADPSAVPWLLVRAIDHAGHGRMSSVTFIQRLDTTDGLAPATPCDASNLGSVVGSDYTATYYFFEASPGAANGPTC